MRPSGPQKARCDPKDRKNAPFRRKFRSLVAKGDYLGDLRSQIQSLVAKGDKLRIKLSISDRIWNIVEYRLLGP